MSPEEHALELTIRTLERLEIPYMVTGSLAASYHGRPRATHDADLVIDPTPAQLESLVHNLQAANFYVDADTAREALGQRRQFNAIEMAHACKIDLIIVKERPYSREEFGRRRPVEHVFDRPISMVTAEDTILSKLEWAKKSGDSARQLGDAAGVLEINPALDRHYIEHWAQQLGVSDLWRAISGGSS